MDYPCAKFRDCTFLVFWFYRADTQTESQTNASHRLTHVTVVGMSNDM